VTANLLVRADLHPALMYLFLDAASEIHGRQTLLADAGRFPNPSRQEFPLSDEAERFYKSGKPFLQRYLPFWVANLADRMLVFLIPLIAVLLPTIRFLPDIIAYRPRARIAALYAKLRALEHEIASTRALHASRSASSGWMPPSRSTNTKLSGCAQKCLRLARRLTSCATASAPKGRRSPGSVAW
jgi:hypothetical protein